MDPLFEVLIIPVLVGFLVGVGSSWYVSRRFRKKAFIDQGLITLKRLCPYRRENERAGDGLGETGWSFLILGEVMKEAGFKEEGIEIRRIGKEIESKSDLGKHPSSDIKAERDEDKRHWEKRILKLY
jgi:hypothetical protein